MDRASFTTVLRNLSPALSKRDLVPIFSCYCFDGTTVHTYDDVVALEMDFDFPLAGGYRGDLLLQWGSSVKGKEVDVSEVANLIQFACGRSSIKLTQIPTENFLFEKPSSKKEQDISVNEEIIAAIGRVLPCVSRDATHPWQFGVTLRAANGALDVYATNNLSAAYTTMADAKGFKDGQVLLLPPRFCDLLVELGRGNALKSFTVYGGNNSGVRASFDNGVRIYSKVSAAADVSRYEQVFDAAVMKQIAKKIRPAPKGFMATVERASLVLDKGGDHTLKFTAKEERLTVVGRSAIGQVKEVLKFPDHEAASGSLDPDYLKTAMERLEEICLLSPNYIAARGDGTTYLFSFVQESEEK